MRVRFWNRLKRLSTGRRKLLRLWVLSRMIFFTNFELDKAYFPAIIESEENIAGKYEHNLIKKLVKGKKPTVKEIQSGLSRRKLKWKVEFSASSVRSSTKRMI